MDKLRTKRIWKAEGLPTPEWLWIEREADLITAAERFGLPLIIKPSEEGSSVGVSKVKQPDQLPGAWKLASGGEGPGGGRVVMAERFIAGGQQGPDCTFALVGGVTLANTPHE